MKFRKRLTIVISLFMLIMAFSTGITFAEDNTNLVAPLNADKDGGKNSADDSVTSGSAESDQNISDNAKGETSGQDADGSPQESNSNNDIQQNNDGQAVNSNNSNQEENNQVNNGQGQGNSEESVQNSAGQNQNDSLPDDVSQTQGNDKESKDNGEDQLNNPWTINVTVKEQLSDGTTRVLAGATVTIHKQGQQEWTSTTAENGECSIVVPGGGDYTVTAEKAAHSSKTEPIKLIGQKFSEEVTIILIADTYKISGTVKDTNGSAITGASITVGSFIVQTDENGTYAVDTLNEGIYDVTAAKQGYVSDTKPDIVLNADNPEKTVDFVLQTDVPEPEPFVYKPIKPVLEKVVDNGDGSYTAYFGYLNENETDNDSDDNDAIELSQENSYYTGSTSSTPLYVFEPGRQVGVITAVFTGDKLVWTLKGPDGTTRTATAGADKAVPGTNEDENNDDGNNGGDDNTGDTGTVDDGNTGDDGVSDGGQDEDNGGTVEDGQNWNDDSNDGTVDDDQNQDQDSSGTVDDDQNQNTDNNDGTVEDDQTQDEDNGGTIDDSQNDNNTGETLPVTGTNINWLIPVGVFFILSGLLVFFRRKKHA